MTLASSSCDLAPAARCHGFHLHYYGFRASVATSRPNRSIITFGAGAIPSLRKAAHASDLFTPLPYAIFHFMLPTCSSRTFHEKKRANCMQLRTNHHSTYTTGVSVAKAHFTACVDVGGKEHICAKPPVQVKAPTWSFVPAYSQPVRPCEAKGPTLIE